MHHSVAQNRIIYCETTSDDYPVLKLDIAPARWTQSLTQQIFRLVAIAILFLCVCLVATLLHQGIQYLTQGAMRQGFGTLAACMAFVGLALMSGEAWLVEATETVHLELGQESFRMSWHCQSLHGKQCRVDAGDSEDIGYISLYFRPMHCHFQLLPYPYRVIRYFPMPLAKLATCALWVGDRPYEFGFYLTLEEQEWVVCKISQFLDQLQDKYQG